MVERTNQELSTQEASETGVAPYSDELRPADGAGSNLGPNGATFPGRTAFDLKELNRSLGGWTDDDLKEIPVVAPGTRLEQGATYIDLKRFEPREFSARGDMVAGDDDWFVPKSQVPYWLWNRLIGVKNPERLDEASE